MYMVLVDEYLIKENPLFHDIQIQIFQVHHSNTFNSVSVEFIFTAILLKYDIFFDNFCTSRYLSDIGFPQLS